MWMYHEIIWETRPDLIIETGTFKGGSALFFANMYDLLGSDGRVITVDISRCPEGYPEHPRIEFITQSSTAPETVATIRSQICPTDRVMVILDSDHSESYVREELELYSPISEPRLLFDRGGHQCKRPPGVPDARPRPDGGVGGFPCQ
jgi:cephalosporin hydroxylase